MSRLTAEEAVRALVHDDVLWARLLQEVTQEDAHLEEGLKLLDELFPDESVPFDPKQHWCEQLFGQPPLEVPTYWPALFGRVSERATRTGAGGELRQ